MPTQPESVSTLAGIISDVGTVKLTTISPVSGFASQRYSTRYGRMRRSQMSTNRDMTSHMPPRAAVAPRTVRFELRASARDWMNEVCVSHSCNSSKPAR